MQVINYTQTYLHVLYEEVAGQLGRPIPENFYKDEEQSLHLIQQKIGEVFSQFEDSLKESVFQLNRGLGRLCQRISSQANFSEEDLAEIASLKQKTSEISQAFLIKQSFKLEYFPVSKETHMRLVLEKYPKTLRIGLQLTDLFLKGYYGKRARNELLDLSSGLLKEEAFLKLLVIFLIQHNKSIEDLDLPLSSIDDRCFKTLVSFISPLSDKEIKELILDSEGVGKFKKLNFVTSLMNFSFKNYPSIYIGLIQWIKLKINEKPSLSGLILYKGIEGDVKSACFLSEALREKELRAITLKTLATALLRINPEEAFLVALEIKDEREQKHLLAKIVKNLYPINEVKALKIFELMISRNI